MSSLLLFLRLFLRQHQRSLLMGLLMAVLTMLSGMALLSLSGWFLTTTAIAGLMVPAALVNVFIPSALIRMFAVGKTAARYAERVLTHDATLRVLATLRQRLFLGWAGPQAAPTLLAHPSRLLFRLTLDIDALDALYLRVLVPWACALLAILTASLVMAWFNPGLGLMVFSVCVIITVLIHHLIGRACRLPVQQRVQGLEQYRMGVIDSISGQTDMLMIQQLGNQVVTLNDRESDIAEADARLHRIETRASIGQQCFNTILLAAVIGACALGVEQGRFSMAVGCALLLLMLATFEFLSPLHRAALDWARIRLAANRLGPRLDSSYEEKQTDAALHIHADSVCLRHTPDGDAVLKDVNFLIEPGQRIALIGSSGAGKSSLLALLSRELPPAEGLFSAPEASLLTQRTEIFRDSIRENLLIADPAATDAALLQALDHAGLGPVIRKLPQGLDTPLGEGALGLSGGQARRLALARLFLRPTPVWLLDEPTEGLDSSTASDVMKRLIMNSQHRTLVIATHTQREACQADRIFRIEGRHLVECVDRGHPRFQELLTSLRTD